MKKKRILLIEDVESHQLAFKKAADLLDAYVECAANLDDARRLVDLAPFGPWDLIVMDMQIPDKHGVTAEVRSGPKLFSFIWPLVEHRKLLIWSVHLDDPDVTHFLSNNGLLRHAIPKGQTTERLRKILEETLAN